MIISLYLQGTPRDNKDEDSIQGRSLFSFNTQHFTFNRIFIKYFWKIVEGIVKIEQLSFKHEKKSICMSCRSLNNLK